MSGPCEFAVAHFVFQQKEFFFRCLIVTIIDKGMQGAAYYSCRRFSLTSSIVKKQIKKYMEWLLQDIKKIAQKVPADIQ